MRLDIKSAVVNGGGAGIRRTVYLIHAEKLARAQVPDVNGATLVVMRVS